MRFLGAVLRSINDGTPVRLLKPNVTRTISTNITSGDDINEDGRANSFESADEFESRIFGGLSGSGSKDVAFFQKLGRAEKAHERTSWDFNWNRENRSETSDGLDDSFSTLSDGMDGKLEKAATYFEFDPDEVEKEDYSFRPDMKFRWGATYDTKDLDLTKPGVSKFTKRQEFEVTTEEVLRKADFRNVRFLANFITDAGIIIKRSKTGISAKAQRKIAREIKTARAFGLMPFTTMGTKSFVYGKTMEPRDEDYEYEVFAGPGNADPEGN